MRAQSVWLLRILLLFLAFSCGYADESPYTVKEKETLFAIARRNQVPVEVLSRANGIEDASRIKAGTVLQIPRSHAVGKGDTLFAISRQYGVPLQGLMALNGLSDAAKIRTGDMIFLPPAADRPAAVAAAPARTSPAAPAPAVTAPDPARKPVTDPQPAGSGGPERRYISWPHPGKREALRGKVTGLAFYGKQGDEVCSVTTGEVSWVGPYWGLGKVIIVRTADGDYILYAGNEALLVNKGDAVSPGMPIARLGLNPAEGVAKLFFSIRTAAGRFVEPERINKG